MANGSYGFTVDKERLREVVLTAYRAYERRRGVFSKGFREYLPEWNLPEDLEFNPQREISSMPYEASLFLWTSAFFERKVRSRDVNKAARRAWADNGKRWFFFPQYVAMNSKKEVEKVIKKDFSFAITRPEEMPLEERYVRNCQRLMANYRGDPRRMIKNKTVDECRKVLMEFDGIGTGIANLYILFLHDRRIASPSDAEEMMLKVDIHKSRIPLNTNSVVTNNHQVYRDKLVEPLERTYREICQEEELDSHIVDSVLWIIGSEVCNTMDYDACRRNCPLSERLCLSNVPEDPVVGRFVVHDEGGKRLDRRKGTGQRYMDFLSFE